MTNPTARGADRRQSQLEKLIRSTLDEARRPVPLVVLAVRYEGFDAHCRAIPFSNLRPIDAPITPEALHESRTAVRKSVNRLLKRGELRLGYRHCWVNLPVSLGGTIEDRTWLCVSYPHPA